MWHQPFCSSTGPGNFLYRYLCYRYRSRPECEHNNLALPWVCSAIEQVMPSYFLSMPFFSSLYSSCWVYPMRTWLSLAENTDANWIFDTSVPTVIHGCKYRFPCSSAVMGYLNADTGASKKSAMHIVLYNNNLPQILCSSLHKWTHPLLPVDLLRWRHRMMTILTMSPCSVDQNFSPTVFSGCSIQ